MATIKEKSKKEKRSERIFGYIQLVLMIAMFALCLWDWKAGACAFFALTWNAQKYEEGCAKWSVDEYEDGYPIEGLRTLFKSWRWLPLWLAGLYLLLVWVSH